MSKDKPDRLSRHVINRQARRREPLPQAEVKIRQPRRLPDPPAPPNWLTVLPMLAMALGTGMIAFFLSGGTGNYRVVFTTIPMVMMASMTITVQRIMYRRNLKAHREKVRKINESYQTYLMRVYEELEDYREEQRRILQTESPQVNVLYQRVKTREATLWERRPDDDDFLSLRIGTAALPSSVEIKVPAPIDEHAQINQAQEIKNEFDLVPDLPLCANLDALGTVGIRGQRSEGLYLAFTMVANIAAHHSPDDVGIYIFSHRNKGQNFWSWARWLPHVDVLHPQENATNHLSFLSETDEVLLLELSKTLRQRSETGSSEKHLVIIFDQTPSLQGQKVISELLAHRPGEKNNSLRASAIFIDEPIPSQVNAIIQVHRSKIDYRETWASDREQVHYEGEVEQTNPEMMDKLARTMAPLNALSSTSASSSLLPRSIRLVELLGETNPTRIQLDKLYSDVYKAEKILSFPVGLDTDLQPLHIELRENAYKGNGLNMMLAGGIGQGKSVLLQTIVLSMALTTSPRYLNIVIADFKAGASELAKLKDLPHVVGYVDDLNEAMVERFRVALESELERRKSLFDEARSIYGVNLTKIEEYNEQFPDDPLPHLVIVIDEYAKGVKMNPALGNVLEALASQARSFALPMILSTQQAKDLEKIRPHIEQRISLHVFNAEDSKAIFKRNDAFTRLNQPGRAFLQVGDNTIFEMFQAARADIPYQPDGTANLRHQNNFSIFSIGPDGRREEIYRHVLEEDSKNGLVKADLKSELELLTDLVRAYCQGRYPQSRMIFLPSLPTAPDLPLLPLLSDTRTYLKFRQGVWVNEDNQTERLHLPLGLIDIPAQQEQISFYVKLDRQDGNFAVIGPQGAGKTLFLRSLLLGLATTHTPDDVHIFILARGSGLSPFTDLPHCGAVIEASEQERIRRMFKYLWEMIHERRRAMNAAGVSVMDQLREVKDDSLLPAVIVVIEDTAGFKADNEELLPELERLVADGKKADLHFVLAGNTMGDIPSRIQEKIQNRLALGPQTPAELQGILKQHAPMLAEIEGRGYILRDQQILECQIASPVRHPEIPLNSPQASEEIRDLVAEIDSCWKGQRPMQVHTLPNHLTIEALWHDNQPPKVSQQELRTAPVGLGYESLEPLSIDFNQLGNSFLVVGPPRSGKTEFLLTLILAAARCLSHQQLEFYILTPQPNHLRSLRSLPHVHLAHSPVQVETMLRELAAELNTKAQIVREYHERQTEMTTREQSLATTRSVIVIDDLRRLLAEEKLAPLIDLCLDAGQITGINLIMADTGNNLNLLKSFSFSSRFIQTAFRASCGVVFSTSQNDLTPLNLQFDLKSSFLARHKPDIGNGRGILTCQGKHEVVQFATLGRRESNEADYKKRLQILVDELISNEPATNSQRH